MATLPRINLVSNPSIETNLTGWTTSGGVQTRINSYGDQMWAALGKRSGSWMLQATSDGTNAYLTALQSSGNGFAVTPGQWVGVSALVASDIPAPGRVRVDVTCEGTATTYHAEPVNDPSSFYAGRRVQYAFLVPATATTGRVRIQGFSGDTGSLLASTNRVWADNVLVSVAATEAEALAAIGTYFDGDTPNTSTVEYSWTGTPHASASIAMPRLPAMTVEPFINDGALRLVLDLATINDYNGRTPLPAETALYVPTTKFTVYATTDAVRLAADADATLTDKVTRTLTGLRVGTRYDVIFQVRRSGAAQVWKAVVGGVTRTFTPTTAVTPGSYIVTFTATATTHDLVFSLNALPTGATSVLLSWLKVTAINTTVQLTRSDFNGTKPVRPPTGGFDITGGRLAYADTEHALTGNVSYTALVRHPGGSTQIETANLNVTGLWATSFIAPPLLPRLGTSVEIVETYEATSATSSVTHNVIGRPDPLVNIGVQRLRSGTMKVWAKDYAHAQAIVKTAGRGQVLQWRQPDYPGLDMYFTAGDASVQPYDERTGTRRWFVLMPYTEVLAPTSNQLGTAVWNMERSTNRNATFFDSFNEFATFTTLMIGPGNEPL